MLIDKEYPATHSMSTAWYIVDEDGNVGIMQCDDNGPSARNTIKGEYVSDIMFGANNYSTNEFYPINLSKEQIQDMLCDPQLPHEVDYLCCNYVSIDASKTERFIEIANQYDIKIHHCISKELGYYYVSSSEKKASEEGLRLLNDENILKVVYDSQPFIYRDDDLIDLVVECPYYLYFGYWDSRIRQQRISNPANPVKENQLSEQIKEKIIRLPIKFSDYEKIQFGEFVPFATDDFDGLQCERFDYVKMELTDGSWAYVRSDQDLDYQLPTAFAICYYNNSTVCGFCPYGNHSENIFYASYMDDWKHNEKITRQEEYDTFAKFQPLMETILKMLKPYLIVIDMYAMNTVRHFYKLSDDKIEICGMQLPYCTNKTITHFDDVYLKPYRGEKLPKVLRINSND